VALFLLRELMLRERQVIMFLLLLVELKKLLFLRTKGVKVIFVDAPLKVRFDRAKKRSREK
jgi:dephospho-CoA kinase